MSSDCPEYQHEAPASEFLVYERKYQHEAPASEFKISLRIPTSTGAVRRMTANSSFNLGEPLAYFLTWTTYGTWLAGDERGWHYKGGPEIQPPNSFLVEMAQSRMGETEFRLSAEHRRIVEETIRGHCNIRGWLLHAVNARSNHVHVVVGAAGYRPEPVRDQFKSWCTRKLKESGEARARFWTEGGSCRWINREDELEAATVYVLEAQDRNGIEDEK